MTGHRVDKRRERKLNPPPPLPTSTYRGERTFVDTDGTEYEIVSPPSHDWPMGSHSSLMATTQVNLREF